MTVRSMLRSSKGNVIPLKSQDVNVSVKDQNASFTIIQNYFNNENNPIETFYTFPTPAGASVYHFEAMTDDGSVIKCVIKEKEQAKQDYDTAMKRGDSAYYMERQSNDVFSVVVGNLAPNSSVKICIKYVVELQDEVDYLKLRIIIPLTIMPRYTPTSVSYSNSSYIAAARAAAAQNTEKISEKPYELSIHGDIHMTDGIKNVDFKTHHAKLSQMRESSVHFDMENLTALDKDIVITIERNDSKSFANTQQLSSNTQQLSSVSNSLYKYATLVKFVPEFSKLPPVDITKVHYVILLDNSASMMGSNIEICKKAAQQFVALLPIGSTFDVYSFNSTYAKFSFVSEDTNERKIKASEWIQKINACCGTDILPALREIYSSIKDLKKSGILVCISDGEVTNTDDVLKTIKQNQNTSVFTIGIGSNVSQALIQGMADQGNGHAEFIGSGDVDLISKVQAQLRKAQDTLRKRQDQYEIEVNTLGGKNRILPETNPVLYQGSNNYMYVFSEFKPVSITYTEKASDSGESFVQTLIPNDSVDSDDSDCMIHRIAGIKLIEHLQAIEPPLRSGSTFSHMRPEKVDTSTDNPSKTEIIEASTILSVLSKYTAFIGIKVNKDKIMDEMHPRVVPLQQPKQESYKLDEILLIDPFDQKMGSCCSTPASKYYSPNVACASAQGSMYGGYSEGSRVLGSNYSEGSRGGGRGGSGNVGVGAESDDESSDAPIAKSVNSKSHVVKKMSRGHGSGFTQSRCSTDSRGSDSERNIDNKNAEVSLVESKYMVTVNLIGEYVSIADGILACDKNKSLINTILELLVINATKNGSSLIDDADLIKLVVGDKIQLTAETNPVINGVYQIISLGSAKEPWVLRKI